VSTDRYAKAIELLGDTDLIAIGLGGTARPTHR
jgi:hypothetical protein